jgi:DNA-binding GntR family transcriptional regulator
MKEVGATAVPAPEGEAPRSDLQAEIVRRIVAMLAEQRPEPGSRLPEQRVAKELSVSRSPVRTAMRFLEAQGFLRSEKGRGFLVARLPEPGEAAQDFPESRLSVIHDRMLRDRALGHIGHEVAEAELAERYGVSRALLARVLARLTGEGLIERLRGHGWGFVEMLENDRVYEDSYEFRIVVECGALRARHFTVDRVRLETMRRQHEEILAAPESVTSEHWFQTNTAFHEMIADFSGNRYFLQAIRHQNNLRRMREYAEFTGMTRARIEQSCREHLAIMEALEGGDLGWVEALLRRHLAQAADYTSLDE